MSINESPVATSQAHLVLVNVDAVQLVLIRAARASTLLRLFELNEDADKLDEAGDLLRQEIETNRGIKNMNTFWKLMAVLVVLLMVGLAAPSVAQDLVTNTPVATQVATAVVTISDAAGRTTSGAAPVVLANTGNEALVVPAWLVIVIVLVVGLVIGGAFLLLGRALKALEKSASPEIVQEIRKGIGETLDVGITKFAEMAQRTANPYDDLLAAIGEPGLKRLAAWLKTLPNEQIGNAGPLPEGLSPRKDFIPPPGVGFGEGSSEPVG